jgi:hypothetical protein
MEVGVHSAGKIGMFRNYFGPSFTYVGIDINPSTKMFESADWVFIEIGNSEDRSFLDELKKKNPHVYIFLDDGGHIPGINKRSHWKSCCHTSNPKYRGMSDDVTFCVSQN